jgi:Tol biopolymer transport system component
MNVKTLALILFIFFLLSLSSCSNGSVSETVQETKVPELPSIPFQGRIVFQSNFDGDNEIYLLTQKRVTKLTDNTWSDEFPVWSPDGTKIAYAADPQGNYDIFVMSPDGTDIKAVSSSPADESEPSWFPDGQSIVYTRETKSMLRKDVSLYRISLATQKTVKVIPHYSRINAIPNVSPEGSLITFTGKRTIGWDVAVYDLNSQEVRFLEAGGKSCRARFSKDGHKLAYVCSKADGKGDIWIMNPDGSQKKRLTERNDTYDYFPSWSPDGRHIVFNSSDQHDHNADWKLYVINVKTQESALLYDSPGNDVFPDWH